MGKVNRRLGQAGEDAAARYLIKNGFGIIARNYRSPWGEIDIVAKDKNILCFIEVKSREQKNCGHPLEAVDRIKREKIIKAAKAYLATNNISPEQVCRFDVVSIEEDQTIILLTDAFQS